MDRQIDWLTDWHKQSNIPPLLWRGHYRGNHPVRFNDLGWVIEWKTFFFQIEGDCDPGLWPTDFQNNTSFQLSQSNQSMKIEGSKGNYSMKFEDSGSNGAPVKEWKQFSNSRRLWPWPLIYRIPKQLGVFFSVRAPTPWSLKAPGQMILELLSANHFKIEGYHDLDLWSTDLKTIRIYHTKRATTLLNLKVVGQLVLELLSGNHFQTEGDCDLDLWLLTPKNKRELIHNKGNHPMKLNRWTDQSNVTPLLQRGHYISCKFILAKVEFQVSCV